MKNHENSNLSANPPQVSASFVEGGASAPLSSPVLKMKLQMNTVGNSRRTLARIIRLYAAGQIPDTQFKNLIYGFSHIIPFFKLEIESELLKRIEQMEQQLEGR